MMMMTDDHDHFDQRGNERKGVEDHENTDVEA